MTTRPMKLSKRVERGRLHVVISGDVDGGRCDCLENYWRANVRNNVTDIVIDMAGVDSIDPIGVATMINLIRDKLGEDVRVMLRAPPQVLAHTVYKTRMSEDRCFSMRDLRDEEPYAG